MKIIKNDCYLAFLLFLGFSMLACSEVKSQKEDAPDAVVKTYESMYPDENDPDWEKDKNGNYEAHFKKKGIHYRVDYSPDGKWIETENSIKEKDLPKAIKELLKNSYKDFKIKEIEFVTHHVKGEFYDLELKEKGKDKFDLMVKANGQIIGRD